MPLELKAGDPAPTEWKPATVAGFINEAIDIFGEDVPLPPMKSGDTLVIANGGAYGTSMSSNHCMRGDFEEYCLLG